MAINGRPLGNDMTDGTVLHDLTNLNTLESDFIMGLMDVATQANVTPTTITLTGDVTGSATLAATNTDNVLSIETTMGTITRADLGNNVVGTSQLLDNSVTSSKIANNAIGSQHIQTNAVGRDEFSMVIEPVANGDPVAADFVNNAVFVVQY